MKRATFLIFALNLVLFEATENKLYKEVVDNRRILDIFEAKFQPIFCSLPPRQISQEKDVYV